MENDRKFDFRKYQLPKGSRWYIAKLIIYGVFLALLIGMMVYSFYPKKKTLTEKELEEILIEPGF
ncbi:MAG: hypothetical protein EP322_04765 [Bacteroidetes bacterium]|nr:MAG: hypothetical protein EP322_04765 [Bacteroidota bacterium]